MQMQMQMQVQVQMQMQMQMQENTDPGRLVMNRRSAESADQYCRPL